MRGLAEYAMSGRRQAVTVAIIFGLIPMLSLLSGAIVALVILRKGMQEGLLVMLWALLPAGLQWAIGDTTPIFMLAGVSILANTLRATGSWSKVLLLATVLGLVLQLSLALQPGYVTELQEIFSELMAQGQELPPLAAGSEASSPEEAVALLLSFYGAYHVLIFTGCLILGRAWQAGLYNPGGFREEFHNLRFDPRVMAVLLALVLGGLAGIAPLDNWMPVFCMAPMFAGLAVIHHVVFNRKLGIAVLVMAYLALLLMSPAIILLGFVDSIFDFRKRWARPE